MRTLHFALTAPCWLLAAALHGQAPELERDEAVVRRDPVSGISEVIIPARGGTVDWKAVIDGIGRAERLNMAAVADVLPSRPLNLNRPGAGLAITAINLALGPGIRMEQRTIDGDQALVVHLDHDAAQKKFQRLKGVLKNVVDRRATESPDFGLTIDEAWEKSPGAPLVIFVHGYNGSRESHAKLADRLRAGGWAVGDFEYPNDGLIEPSGRDLAHQLHALARRHPEAKVTLLAHSMGGLVSRTAIELADPPPPNVQRLIMVATPNQGSQLALIPGGLDVVEHLIANRGDGLKGAVRKSLQDGLNEARQDMKPQSPFLARLNRCRRNPQVRYSLLLGDGAPSTPEEVAGLKQDFATLQAESRLLQVLGPRIDDFLKDIDELTGGRGDGAVALSRGRIEGIEDVVVLHFIHEAFNGDFSNAEGQTLLAEIVKRLPTP